MELIELLHVGALCAPADRRRRWVEPGRPMVIASNLLAQLRVDRDADTDACALRVVLTTPSQALEFGLDRQCALDCTDWAGLWLVPRAWRRRGRQVDAVLMEFIRRRPDVQFALSCN